MRFRVTATAEQDLVEIGDYIALDNKSRARSFIAEIEARFVAIARQPAIYRVRDEIMLGVRAAAHGRYRIWFRKWCSYACCTARGATMEHFSMFNSQSRRRGTFETDSIA